MANITRQYDAEPTLQKFHASDKSIRCVRGPIGSGKSVAMAIEILRRASEMPPSTDGVRRSRCVVVRNTLQQLKSTCLVTLQEWLRPITRWKVSDATLYMEFTPADGIPVVCEILMLPLDTPENQQRLLSLELTFGWISEFREIPLEIMQAVFSRLGRYPSRANVSDYWYGLWAETNSFSEDSDYFNYLEIDRPGNVDYFVQPGGMESNAENRAHLPPRYYEDQIEANDPAWVSQYVHNQITESLSGQAVFSKTFSHEFHTSDELFFNAARPIVIGVDTGRNPAAVFGQIDPFGRLLVLSSLYAENMGIEKFINSKIQPHIAEHYPNGRFFVAIDPAARQRSQIGEQSVLDAVREKGFSVITAPTNDISPRLRAVERYMNMQLDGKAGFLVDTRYNVDLLKAIKHGYRYKRKKEGTLDEKPEKSHPDSDLCDAMQYLCLCVGSNTAAYEFGINETRSVKKVSAGGWT